MVWPTASRGSCQAFSVTLMACASDELLWNWCATRFVTHPVVIDVYMGSFATWHFAEDEGTSLTRTGDFCIRHAVSMRAHGHRLRTLHRRKRAADRGHGSRALLLCAASRRWTSAGMRTLSDTCTSPLRSGAPARRQRTSIAASTTPRAAPVRRPSLPRLQQQALGNWRFDGGGVASGRNGGRLGVGSANNGYRLNGEVHDALPQRTLERLASAQLQVQPPIGNASIGTASKTTASTILQARFNHINFFSVPGYTGSSDPRSAIAGSVESGGRTMPS
ncbi:hypothetical protein B0H10DRAFT_2196716, partial [Mycena sp. CBHHK59/15]